MPLPLSLLLHDDTEYEVREAIDEGISSILPVYDDCATVHHKSLRDWLTSDGYKQHAFTVEVFNETILLSNLSSLKPFPFSRYGISHMIQSGSETGYHLSVDVKIHTNPHRFSSRN